MKINKVEIQLFEKIDGLKGIASITLNNILKLNSIGIYANQNKKGYRITYPTKQGFYMFHPINPTLSKQIEKEIISTFKIVNSKHDRYNQT